jgi:hypothetical protein
VLRCGRTRVRPLRDELMGEFLSPMSRLCVDVEDVRGRPAARVGSRWVVLVEQHARARDDQAVGFREPADVLARGELANEAQRDADSQAPLDRARQFPRVNWRAFLCLAPSRLDSTARPSTLPLQSVAMGIEPRGR